MHTVTVNGRIVHQSDALPVKSDQPITYDGSGKWRALHLAALKNEITAEWLTDWQKDIPTFGCTCLSDWLRWLQKNSLPSQDQFAWSVDAHNAVNRKLRKSILSIEKALALWQ